MKAAEKIGTRMQVGLIQEEKLFQAPAYQAEPFLSRMWSIPAANWYPFTHRGVRHAQGISLRPSHSLATRRAGRRVSDLRLPGWRGREAGQEWRSELRNVEPGRIWSPPCDLPAAAAPEGRGRQGHFPDLRGNRGALPGGRAGHPRPRPCRRGPRLQSRDRALPAVRSRRSGDEEDHRHDPQAHGTALLWLALLHSEHEHHRASDGDRL